MEPPPITTQPMRSDNSEKPTELSAVIDSNTATYPIDATEYGVKENLTEVNAVFTDMPNMEEMTEEEKEKRRQQEDCCCVWTPDYADDTDVFCMYIMCRWICDCFRGIGQCTESCFEGCANCLSGCCEGDACCSCDGDAGDTAADGSADCLTGCADCCSSCDCDCSS